MKDAPPVMKTLLWAAIAVASAFANPIQNENALPGTTAWRLANPAVNHEIEGYASLTSVNQGGQISLFVSTADPSYQIDIYRMGWYAGAGARQVAGPIARTGILQLAPSSDSFGMIECQWTNPYVLTVPLDWVSGYYLAKLTGSRGKQSYIIFVVREDSRPSTFLMQASVTTWQAYNNWGGRSMYPFNSNPGLAAKVSFNRPYAVSGQASGAAGVGAGEFLNNFQLETTPPGFEYNMVRFLEREGYDVAYATDVDTHENGALLLLHKSFLIVGHDEYWSMAMRNNVIAARDKGVNIGVFASDTSMWQIRFETSPATGAPDRTQVCYKSIFDPVSGPTQTVMWRDLGMPEESFIGVQFTADPVHVDVQVTNTSHWVFAGTGLHDGDKLPGLLGYEGDDMFFNSPPNITILGSSSGLPAYANNYKMTIYTAASGAYVFAAGTMQFSWGLDDDYNIPPLRPSVLNPAVQTMMRNILAKFGAGSIAVSVSPATATLYANQTQQFSATVTGTSNTAVSWNLSPPGVGSISASGFYTAPAVINSSQTVTVVATSIADSSTSSSATVTLSPPIGISVSPSTVTLFSGQQQAFTATVANSADSRVTWTITPPGTGTISSTGLYTAPTVVSASQAVNIIATSVADPTKSASASVNLVPTVIAVSVTPANVSLGSGQTQAFAATVSNTTNQSVTWSLNPTGTGTISSSGAYTAPATITTAQTIKVIATSVADLTKSASASVNLVPTVIAVSVTPANVSLGSGQTQAFAATVSNTTNQSVTWSLNPTGTGTISSSGAYTAPATITTAQTIKVIATSVADPTKSASASVNLVPTVVAVSVTPANVSLGSGQTQAFTAGVSNTTNQSVTWSLNPTGTGTISSSGAYTAPVTITTAQTIKVIATSVADPTKSGQATVNLTPPVSGNAIQIENARPGTTAWQLTNPASNHEIEGYASLTSVNQGGQISLFVSTADPSYQIDIYRMGWYGGAGARQVAGPIARTGALQLSPSSNSFGMVECRWTNPYLLSVPSNWVSGFYLARLMGSKGKQSYIIFVVREDARQSAFLFQSSVTTWQAYNNWGGKSLYPFNSPEGTAVKVSFNRPYAAPGQPSAIAGVGAGEFLNSYQQDSAAPGWEYNMVRFLEREGYDVTYSTDVDTHENGNLLLQHKAFLIVGHDVYWSMAMRKNVIAARDRGVNIGVFSSGTSAWQIRFETSPATGAADRTEVCYKSIFDPVSGPTQTVMWRDLGKPEEAFIGIQFASGPVHVNLQVSNTSHWVFSGSGLQDGDSLPGLVGFDGDDMFSSYPSTITVLGSSSGIPAYGNNFKMTIYTAPSGAYVFAAGTSQFSWGLDDDYNVPALRPSVLNAAARTMMRNILARFGSLPQ